MESYTIRVHVEMVPCHELPTHEAMKPPDGSVQITIAEDEAINIDPLRTSVVTDSLSDPSGAPVEACERGVKKSP